jgi:hypothetical protein
MLRFLNVIAIVALVGSAVYAYSIKYQTSFRAEQILEMKQQVKAERDAIAVLRAEWSYLTRPERLQRLSDRYLDLQQLTVGQIVAAPSIPDRADRVDSIGRTLDSLGLGGSTNTPGSGAQNSPTTPKTAKATGRKP